jgi:hypothetical protein
MQHAIVLHRFAACANHGCLQSRTFAMSLIWEFNCQSCCITHLVHASRDIYFHSFAIAPGVESLYNYEIVSRTADRTVHSMPLFCIAPLPLQTMVTDRAAHFFLVWPYMLITYTHNGSTTPASTYISCNFHS